MMENEKQCMYCGRHLKRRYTESKGNFARRQFCSFRCFVRYFKTAMVEVECLGCGKKFSRNYFSTEKYCNPICRQQHYYRLRKLKEAKNEMAGHLA